MNEENFPTPENEALEAASGPGSALEASGWRDESAAGAGAQAAEASGEAAGETAPPTAAAAPEPVPLQPQAAARAGAHGETWWETLRSLIVVLIAVVSIRTFVAEATVIPTGSMENTILIGDHVFLNKLLYGPEVPYTSWRLPVLRPIHRGDIVAFHYPVNPSQMFVKRVIAMGGDVIKVVNKQVYVNGVKLYEPYAQFESDANMPLIVNFPPRLDEIPTLPAWEGLDPKWAHEMPKYIRPDGLHVPEGYFFAMGDNRDNSDDSRFWGFVSVQSVVGEPLFVYWSYDAPTRDWVADSLTARLRFDASIVKNFLKRTRWSRTGKAF
ncbi:MAG TPA: signal peptidase I [Terriglobia bacterium]|nr:signal peptidase I [Terriglobia bacterium]